jgi:hypothetical protein
VNHGRILRAIRTSTLCIIGCATFIGCGPFEGVAGETSPQSAAEILAAEGLHCALRPAIEKMLDVDDGSSHASPDVESTLPEVQLCPEGSVAVPKEIYEPKLLPAIDGEPGGALGESARALSSLTYYYAGTYQRFVANGTEAVLAEHSPSLSKGDGHTLVEIAAQSADGKQIVEVGWIVSPNFGTGPRLFVFHWVDGRATCYNGCGWVQVSTKYRPGMSVTPGSAQKYKIVRRPDGHWWVAYRDEWLGYFPSSEWGGRFSQMGLIQWFGEVAAFTSPTCTDMGNGVFGSNNGSASVSNIALNPSRWIPANIMTSNQTNSRFYNVVKTSATSFRFGGPGGC